MVAVAEYDSVQDAIRRPTRTVGLSEYFFVKWWPLLGDRYGRIVVQLRMLAQKNDQPEWETSAFSPVAVTYDELSRVTQIPTRSLKRLLSASALVEQPHVAKFLRIENCYEYHSDTGRRVRGANRYYVRMMDPLVPDDEARMAADSDRNLAVVAGGEGGRGEGEVERARSLLSRLAEELSDLNRSTCLRLINEVGAEEVERQLDWLSYRDISGFRNGRVAAFVTFCQDRRPKPKRLERLEERAAAKLAARNEEPAETLPPAPPPQLHPIFDGLSDSRRRALAPMVREVTVADASITIWCRTAGELALLKSYKEDLVGAAFANLGRLVEVRFSAAEQEPT